jgi:23S rRNA (adenine2503-C2)-methyltransferase
MMKVPLCGSTAGEIFDLLRDAGFTMNHAVSVSIAVYKKGISEIPEIPKIPKKLIEELEANFISGIFRPVTSELSADKTIKYLFRTESGKEFETVFMPGENRNTLCVSTQSGCRMGCPFCVTGSYGFHGNLSAGEIVNQVISIPGASKITHVVFMGMGEPMDNLENVLKACRILTAEWGLAISQRNITVSTVGITPGIKIFLESSECNLTLSLYSPFPDERKLVVPAETAYPVSEIINIMKNYRVKKKRRLSVAYVMIKELNDTDHHLEGLKALLKGTGIRVNLLPYHVVPGDNNASSSADRIQFFKHNLVVSGISASVRRSRGTDISAACGLLATGMQIRANM